MIYKTSKVKPLDGQEVYYYFEPFNRWYPGEYVAPEPGSVYKWGSFVGYFGFCDEYDAPKWRNADQEAREVWIYNWADVLFSN